MDLEELNHHAKRYGQWSMRLSKTEELVCRFDPRGNPPVAYHYLLNGRLIHINKAERLISKAFEKAMAS